VGSDVIKTAAIPILLFCAPALACEYPDEGNMPLRRAVSAVRYLPEVEAWAEARHKDGAVVQYALRLDRPLHEAGRCYRPVEVRAGPQLWRRYYVAPTGELLR
jgi:hypothetical protein